jgi:hypothetical protein
VAVLSEETRPQRRSPEGTTSASAPSARTSFVGGSIPGVYLGARLSSKASDNVLKPVIMVLLTASGAKLLGVGNLPTLLGALVMAGYGVSAWLVDRRRLARYLATRPGGPAAPLAPNAPVPELLEAVVAAEADAPTRNPA